MPKPSIDHLQERLENICKLLAQAGELVNEAGGIPQDISTPSELSKPTDVQSKILGAQAQLTGMYAKIVDDMRRWHEAHGVDPWKKPTD